MLGLFERLTLYMQRLASVQVPAKLLQSTAQNSFYLRVEMH